MTVTRRRFLKTAGTAAVSLAAVSGRARATHPSTQPEHVTIEYDPAILEESRPRFVFEPADRRKLIGQYGWLATSPEFDTDCCVYWLSYTRQNGVTYADSHDGDHEPVYCFIDSETGEFREIIASIYHWTRGRSTNIPMDADGHPQLRVINPWHHYTAAEEAGELLEVKDLTEHWDAWLANGMEEDVEPGTVYNPWRMQGPGGRGHWWRDGWLDISLTEITVSIARSLGRREAGSL